jgi:hypothetical protein
LNSFSQSYGKAAIPTPQKTENINQPTKVKTATIKTNGDMTMLLIIGDEQQTAVNPFEDGTDPHPKSGIFVAGTARGENVGFSLPLRAGIFGLRVIGTPDALELQ